MLYRLAAYVHAFFARRARRIVAALEGEGGQGTVEYVGLILLVSLLMVGMVAAMKGFNRHWLLGQHPCVPVWSAAHRSAGCEGMPASAALPVVPRPVA
jgi:hypothetical protein